MSDFLLYLNPIDIHKKQKIVSSLKYYDDINVFEYDYDNFNLFLSRADNLDIWAPYQTKDKSVLVALAGRIALEIDDWEKAKKLEGPGGLACKAIYDKYLSGGVKELEKSNGNFTIIVIDSTKSAIHIINDRAGMFPCYGILEDKKASVIGSHPDIVAMSKNISNDLDIISIAEFLMTGKVSIPYSYYNNLITLDYGSVYTVSLEPGNVFTITSKKYFEFKFNIEHGLSEWELAEQLASAFRKAINRRTLPQVGHAWFSLSGGLDSRAFLCAADDKRNISAFSFYDDENLEYKIAKQIADKVGVSLIPLKRDFDHYGDNAEMGTKIAGGMGEFASNHFIGFRDLFKHHCVDNIIAGFSCDYFFKGLLLNKILHKYLRLESLSKFSYESYDPIFWFDTVYKNFIQERLDDLFPNDLKIDESDLGRLEIERRRLFPLHRVACNQQTVVAQRVMSWYLPIVDNDIIETYLMIPPKFKLNTSMYSKAVALLCGKDISKITNINTHTKVNASRISVIFHEYINAVKKRIKKQNNTIVMEESWPNWTYYISNSKKIAFLWQNNKNEIACDLFNQILGSDPYKKSIQQYASSHIKLFFRLLTIKLWLDKRIC